MSFKTTTYTKGVTTSSCRWVDQLQVSHSKQFKLLWCNKQNLPQKGSQSTLTVLIHFRQPYSFKNEHKCFTTHTLRTYGLFSFSCSHKSTLHIVCCWSGTIYNDRILLLKSSETKIFNVYSVVIFSFIFA